MKVLQQHQQQASSQQTGATITLATSAAQSTDGAAKTQSVVQPSFPQGSILVVPHQQGGFQALPLLPMFANTAVVMPQGVSTSQQQVPASKAVVSTSISKDSRQESEKERMEAVAAKEGPRMMVEAVPTTSSMVLSVVREPHVSGRREERREKGGVQVSGKDKLPQQSVVGSAPTQGVVIPSFPVYVMNVGPPVKLESFDFRSKSVEISGEVPIRAVEVNDGKETTILLSDLRELMGDKLEGSGADDGNVTKREKSSNKPSQGHETLKGHTSTEVMSAKMLLSLTGRSDQVSPLDKEPPGAISSGSGTAPTMTDAGPALGESAQAASSPSASTVSSNRQTPTGSKGARKRKQKPTPSVKPSEADRKKEHQKKEKEDGKSEKSTPTTAKGKRSRKPKSTTAEETPEKGKSSTKSKKGSQKSGKGEGLSEQQLLSGASSKEKSPSTKSRLKTAKEVQTASARMEQLKAERGSRPVKEFVIESSSGSDSGEESDSSSGSGSTSFSPNSGSSSDSSSDSSSETQQPAEPKPSPQKVTSGRGRGRGRGRGMRGRGGRGGGRGGGVGKPKEKVKSHSSSSEGSSDEEEEDGELTREVKKQKRQQSIPEKGNRGRVAMAKGRGRGRGAGRGGRGRPRKDPSAGHIVSIPTDLLESIPAKKKQRKQEVCVCDMYSMCMCMNTLLTVVYSTFRLQITRVRSNLAMQTTYQR